VDIFGRPLVASVATKVAFGVVTLAAILRVALGLLPQLQAPLPHATLAPG
jgi:hypothetical protein